MYIIHYRGSTQTWIAATRSDTSSDWTWSDGTAWPYNFPTSSSNNEGETCARIRLTPTGGKLFDSQCSESYAVLCRKPTESGMS